MLGHIFFAIFFFLLYESHMLFFVAILENKNVFVLLQYSFILNRLQE